MTGDPSRCHPCRRISLIIMSIMSFLCYACSTPEQREQPRVRISPVTVNKQRRSQSSAPATDQNPASGFSSLSFTGMIWQWLGNLIPTETLKVDQPGRYTLKFRSDGWFSLQADCRQGEGIYETSGRRIAMAVVKLTDAVCPPGSRQDLYVNSLESAGSFRTTGDRLYLQMRREARTMVFWGRK